MKLSLLVVLLCSAVLQICLCNNCPVWFYRDNTTNACLCNDDIEGYISCSEKDNFSYLQLGKAIGYRRKSGDAVVAHIPYIYPAEGLVDKGKLLVRLNMKNDTTDRTMNALEALEYLCGRMYRDVGVNYTYCGHCKRKEGYGPALYSFGIQCTKCSLVSGSLKYFALQILPISIFYGVVLLFRVDLTRPNMFHYVVFCNSITFMFRYSAGLAMSYLYSDGSIMKGGLRLGLTLSGVWTLDFLRFVVPPFCISPKVHDCMVPFFDFFPVVYLLLLTAVISVLIKLHSYKIRFVLCVWRPFQRVLERFKLNRDPVEAVVHTYATFFFLYLFKTASVAFITALTSPAYSQDNKKTERLTVFYDPTTKYFNGRHIAIIMTSFTVAAVLIIPAICLLTFFRTGGVQRFYQMQLSRRWQVIVRIFVQTLENGYKDGTNGTKDLRPVSGVFFLLIILGCVVVIILLRNLEYTDNIPWPFAVGGFTLLAVMYGTLRPYKKRSDNNMAVFMYGMLVVISNFFCFTQQRSEGTFVWQRKIILGLTMCLVLLVNIIYSVYLTHKIFRYFHIHERIVNLVRCICFLCRCPCRRIFKGGEEEEQRLLSNNGHHPAYYQ